jgi:programmed cell death protein 5
MDELAELRKRRLAMLQQQARQADPEMQEQMHLAQQIEALEGVVKQVLDKEAWARYANIKAADPERAVRVLAVVGQLAQAGRVRSIDDARFKALLAKMTPQKRETKIRRV